MTWGGNPANQIGVLMGGASQSSCLELEYIIVRLGLAWLGPIDRKPKALPILFPKKAKLGHTKVNKWGTLGPDIYSQYRAWAGFGFVSYPSPAQPSP